MRKYHINSKGNPGVCHAEFNCPFGGDDEHFVSVTEARSYAEELLAKEFGQQIFNKKTKEFPETIEEFNDDQTYNANLLASARAEKRTLSQMEVSKHENFAISLIDYYKEKELTTADFYAEHDPIVNRRVYNKARRQQQKEIIDHFLAKLDRVPCEGKMLFSGGLGGAGKSYVLENHAGVQQEEYLTINPDDFKEEMARRGMMPKIKGLTPMEVSPLAHEEASMLAKIVLEEAASRRANIIIDGVMGNPKSAADKMRAAKKNDYNSVDVIFVDITPETSYRRASSRYRIGLNEYTKGENSIGGRILPKEVTDSLVSDNPLYNSKPAEVVDTLVKRNFFTNKPVVFSNNVDGEEPKRISN